MDRFRLACGLAAALVLAAPAAARAYHRVVPRALAGIDTGFGTTAPFSAQDGSEPIEMRLQQVFDAAEFGVRPRRVSAIAFRHSPGPPGAAGTIPDLEIRLATTAQAVDGLSQALDENPGADSTTVYAGELVWTGTASCPFPGPCAFEDEIVFATPFDYDPAQGNLLLDVHKRSAAGMTGLLCVASNDEDSVSRAYVLFDGDGTQGQTDSGGLVVRFTLPEPGAGASGLAAAAALAAHARRRR